MSKPVEMPWSEPTDAEGVARGDAALGAEALDNLLRILGDQISTADRQHGESMREMQTRLARIGDRTETVKAGLPLQHATAFERIEDGMAELAERFAESNRAHQAPRSEPEPELEVAPAPDVRTPTPSYSVPEGDGLDFIPAITSKSVFSTRPATVFEDRWDRQDAEALTRHYEDTDDDLPPRRSAFQAPPKAVASTEARPPSAPTPSAVPMDAAWLETRLADIAERVEQSLAVLRPESQLLAINQRFDQFESRVGRVLDDVAARADVQGLGEVEKQIGDLSRQLDHVVGQLGRLERLEGQIGTLRHKLTDEHIVSLFGDLVPTQDDLVRFAEQAATNVAKRGISGAPATGEPSASGNPDRSPDDAGAIASLHGLLSSSIEERQRGDASTAETLDVVQLALQQVLDRIESLEGMIRQPRADDSPLGAPEPKSIFERIDRLSPEHRLGSSETPVSHPHATLAPTHHSLEPDRIAFTQPETHTRYEPPAPPPLPVIEAPPVDLEPPPPPIIGPDGLIMAPPRSRAKAPVDRKHMIELARQAAENARAQSATEIATRNASGRKSLFQGSGAAEAGGKGGVRTGILLLATIAAFLLAASFFILGPQMRPGNSTLDRPPVRAVTPTEPDAAPAKSPAINEEAPPPAPKQQGRGPTPPAPDRRADADPVVPAQIASNDDQSGADVGRFAASAPASAQPSPSVVGIAVEGSERAVTALDLARARQRAHLANLSAQTAHNAARSAVPETTVANPGQGQTATAIVTAAIPSQQAATPSAPRPEAAAALELPPALIGPNSLRTAAANGDASAQFEVASRFAEAKGVKQNFAQAAVWYQRAATRGLAQAQYRLGSLYERGLGVDRDPARARVWYARAAEQGNLKAMHNLAVLSAGSDHGAPDYTAASHWFGRAAEHGLADSQYNLGVLHENGLGVQKSPMEAYKWYALAAAGGDMEAARRRDLLKPKLDPATLATAVRAVGDWKARQPNALANDPRVAGEAWKARAQAAQ